jgi:flagellin
MISGVGVGVAGTGTNGVGEIGTLGVTAAGDSMTGTLSVTDSNGTAHSITLGTAGSTDTLGDLAATINASGWGISANLFAGTTNENSSPASATSMVLTSASSKSSIAGTNLVDTNTADANMLTNTPTPGTQFSSTVGTLSNPTAANDGAYGDTLSGAITIGSQTITIGSADNTLASLASTINAGAYGVTATYSQANADIVFTSANSATTISAGADGLTDTTATASKGSSEYTTLSGTNNINSAGPSSTDNSAYYSVGIASSGGIVDHTTVVNTGTVASPVLTYGGTGVYNSTAAKDVNANTGMVSDLSGTNGIATISYSDKAGQSLAKSDLTSQGDAQTALTSLNAAISDVSAQDGYIGAQINTLNSASSVLSTQSENVQSAQNAVQATDYASATSNMSKYEILSQTGISALAQANSMQQEVTKLLQ